MKYRTQPGPWQARSESRPEPVSRTAASSAICDTAASAGRRADLVTETGTPPAASSMADQRGAAAAARFTTSMAASMPMAGPAAVAAVARSSPVASARTLRVWASAG
jgi:hypothetical protein